MIELTDEQRKQLDLLDQWKCIFNSPNHTVKLDNGIVESASIGLLPDPDKSCEYNKIFMATNANEIPYLGEFPLPILKKGPESDLTIITVNPKFNERSLFNEYVMMKMGLLNEIYFRAWIGEETFLSCI